ncbi:MAG: hypothetical protein QJR02_10230 [Sinobacteraceae bacterium]|nr:hypothetical protein [Nevskiaceae bacterium]
MSAQREADWLELLRAACASSTQAAVARRLGYSSTVVNQVLKGTYSGDLQRVKAAVEGALMQAEVDCPVCGSIPRQRCVEHQRAPFRATSPMSVQLYRACRGGCPHSLLPAGAAPAAQPEVARNAGSRGVGSMAVPRRLSVRVTRPSAARDAATDSSAAGATPSPAVTSAAALASAAAASSSRRGVRRRSRP